jgi:hypothetical protein
MTSYRWKTVNDVSKDIFKVEILDFSNPEDGGQKWARRHTPRDFNLRQHRCETNHTPLDSSLTKIKRLNHYANQGP